MVSCLPRGTDTFHDKGIYFIASITRNSELSSKTSRHVNFLEEPSFYTVEEDILLFYRGAYERRYFDGALSWACQRRFSFTWRRLERTNAQSPRSGG